jgi:hypothetical protein
MQAKAIRTLAAAAMLFGAAGVQASPITTWQVDVNTVFDTSTVLPAGVTIVNDKELRWGTAATGAGDSGLLITDSPISTFVDTDGPLVSNVSVTHRNNPITGTSLSSVDILSTLTLTPFAPPGPGLPSATITFGINFLETPNGADPCADGGVNGAGVNVNGCGDIFVISQDSLNFSFQYADIDDPAFLRTYFISFVELSSGLNPLSSEACAAVGVTSPCLGFVTPEEATSTVQFAALITTDPVVIPEPGALALVGLGLGLAGFARRQRRVAR